jgi:hypothetical protein
MSSGFPAQQRRRINAHFLGHLPMRKAEPSARGGKALREGDGGRQRVAPKELESGRDVTDGRGDCVAFPVRNRGFANADLFGRLLLEEFEFEAAGADVVALVLVDNSNDCSARRAVNQHRLNAAKSARRPCKAGALAPGTICCHCFILYAKNTKQQLLSTIDALCERTSIPPRPSAGKTSSSGGMIGQPESWPHAQLTSVT